MILGISDHFSHLGSGYFGYPCYRIMLVISVIDQWHSSLAIGVFVHEASALVIILNGIWLADKGMSRFGILGTLFKQLGADCIEAWKSLKALMLASK